MMDWKMLRQQKNTLLKVIHEQKVKRYKQTEEDLTGLLHLIDSIQDDAVKRGVPEEDVFELIKE
jgi:hypothetical protein